MIALANIAASILVLMHNFNVLFRFFTSSDGTFGRPGSLIVGAVCFLSDGTQKVRRKEVHHVWTQCAMYDPS